MSFLSIGTEQNPIAVRELTEELGADVAIEAVGVPATFELGVDRPAGRIPSTGVHGKPATLHLKRLWDRNRLLTSHQIDGQRFVTHHFGFGDVEQAYDVFAPAGETGAMRVILGRNG